VRSDPVTLPRAAGSPTLEDKAFLALLVAVSLAFAWILWPFFGAVLWAVILAILFAPPYRRLLKSKRPRRTLAALATLGVILVLVILPLTLLTALLVQEGAAVYERIQSGEFDIGRYFQQTFNALPGWLKGLLDRFGLTNLGLIQARLSDALKTSSQFLAGRALNLGQNTLNFVLSLFVMLYLLFFLLRDGDTLVETIRAAIPLHPERLRTLAGRFTGVIRATVKGTLVVAVVQGALGGLIFWLLGIHAPVLWAALMAVLSLLPAVGAALVWLPVAVYFVATGAIWQGIVLTAYGVLVIGLVDNVLRPILVGKDTRMPDYVVLISTLGGIAVLGINGFVIGPVIAAMFIAVWGMLGEARSASGSARPEE
jgi:predicted PurR-regulated permease PerM